MLLRPAEPGDEMNVARVHVRAWQAGYRELLPQGYLDALRVEDRARRYDFVTRDPHRPATVVAVDEGTICGFATTVVLHATPECGELAALYVDPQAWCRGVGTALTSAACAALHARGCREAVLWLLAGNTRGDRFYRRNGWLAQGVGRKDVVWGVEVDELRYRRALL